jgi:DNA-binding transcriptional LysR family regulator
MELRHIRYFIAVAEELNFRRAAARLHMAQPPLSVQIQDLERHLGVSLFDRSGRRISLTREGEVFLLEARQICEQVSRASHAVHQAAAGELGRLRVAGVPYAFKRELPTIIPKFRRENPNILVDLREAGTQDSLDALAAETLDVALVRQGDPVDGLEILPLRTGRFEAVLPLGHRLAGAGAIDLADLARDPFVVTSRRSSPYYNDRTLSALSAAGITPRAVIEATSIQAQLGFVACGMGVSLAPASSRPMQPHHVVWLPLKQTVTFTEVAAAWGSGPVPPVLEPFLRIVRELIVSDSETLGPGPGPESGVRSDARLRVVGQVGDAPRRASTSLEGAADASITKSTSVS